MSEYNLLQDYVRCLQLQNQTKNKQRQTLYTELQKMQYGLQKLQEQLISARSQTNETETSHLRLRLRDLQEQIEILKYEQHHLFEQNLSLISGLDSSSNKIVELQRENKDLKCQKEELQKFRFVLERISKSLEELQNERGHLVEANLTLVEQNSYLKGLLQSTQGGFHLMMGQNVVQSNYLMSKSFEKISEYEEQYEQSIDDCKYYPKNKLPNDRYITDENQSGEEQRASDIIELALIKKDEHCDGSYLMLDERETDRMRVSYEVQQNQRQMYNNPTNDLVIEHFDKVDKHSAANIGSQTQRRNHEQSSCDVIQQLQQQFSNYQPNNKMTEKSQHLIRIFQLQSLNKKLHQQLQTMRQSYKESQHQKQQLQAQFLGVQRNQQNRITEMEQKIQELLKNYQVIVNYSEQLENENLNYSAKIQQLQNHLYQQQKCHPSQSLNQKQKQRTKRSIKTKPSHTDLNFLETIDQRSLIKQNNILIQKMNQIERQKNTLYHQVKESQYSSKAHSVQSAHSCQFQEEQKQNLMDMNRPSINSSRKIKKVNSNVFNYKSTHPNQSNIAKSSPFQNYFNSKLKSTNRTNQMLIDYDSETSNGNCSEIKLVENRLQKRIQRIKSENQLLLKELQLF